jgi:hypothetical protein
MEALCKCWNIEVNEDKTLALYFSHQIRPSESLPTWKGRNIPFVNSVKYLGVIFDKKIIWNLHIETVQTKAFKILVYYIPPLKSDQLVTNIKLTLYKSRIRILMTYACPTWELQQIPV